jgi:hypothetical protein
MARKHHTAEEIINHLRQVEVLVAQDRAVPDDTGIRPESGGPDRHAWVAAFPVEPQSGNASIILSPDTDGPR